MKPRPQSLTTWIPGSTDGSREARKLQNHFAQGTALKAPQQLKSGDLPQYYNLVVVGHRSEFGLDQQRGLAGLVKGSGCGSLVLAMCSSAMGETSNAALGENDLWTMGQRMANLAQVPVVGTLRPLTFDEVGKGEAFALAHGAIVIPSEPHSADGSRLWQEFRPQGDIDAITEGIGRL